MSIEMQAIRKTRKLFIGGAFVRSESGRVLKTNTQGRPVSENYSWTSRKDLRDSVSSARAAFEGWAKRTPYLRGQILYRVAEMLQQRSQEFAEELRQSTGIPSRRAFSEISASIDQLVYFAGWSDKFSAVFSSVNPVASAHFNFTTPEPVGVVAILCPDSPSLLAPATLIASAIASGNTVVLLASEQFPMPALTLAEVLATSDIPAGVVNILAGKRKELAPHMASHMDINAVLDAANDPATSAALQSGQSLNLKRYSKRNLSVAQWFSDKLEDPYWILDMVEYKTAWHPVGV